MGCGGASFYVLLFSFFTSATHPDFSSVFYFLHFLIRSWWSCFSVMYSGSTAKALGTLRLQNPAENVTHFGLSGLAANGIHFWLKT